MGERTGSLEKCIKVSWHTPRRGRSMANVKNTLPIVPRGTHWTWGVGHFNRGVTQQAERLHLPY